MHWKQLNRLHIWLSLLKFMVRRAMQQAKSGQARIIEAIDKPLGFYVLALLIVEGFLSLILIFSDLTPRAQEAGMWAVVGLFIFVVGVVTLCVWYRPKHLIYSELASLVESGKATYGTETNAVVPRTPDELPTGVSRSEESD